MNQSIANLILARNLTRPLEIALILWSIFALVSCQSPTQKQGITPFPHVEFSLSPPQWNAGDTIIINVHVVPAYQGAVPSLAQLYVSGENVHLDAELNGDTTILTWPTDSLSFTIHNQNTVWMTGFFKFPDRNITFGTEERFQVVQNSEGLYQLEQEIDFYYLQRCPCAVKESYISPTRANASAYIEQILSEDK